MVNSGSLSALLAVVLLAVVECGPSDQKLATCCTKVSSEEINEPILGYLHQKANAPCVNAVIFQTQSGLFCIYVRAPWILRKINEWKAKARSTIPSAVSTSPASLLSIIMSTASPSSPSTALRSSSSTSNTSPPETLSESRDERASV